MNKVIFPKATPEGEAVIVERVKFEDINNGLATAYLELERAVPLSGGEPLLDPIEQDTVEEEVDWLRRVAQKGSQLWVIRADAGQEQPKLLGQARIGPAKDAVCLHEIQVLRQRVGLGSLLLYVALSKGGWDESAPLTLSVFTGSTASSWYESLGMVSNSPRITQVILRHYTTPPGFGIRGILDKMVERRPHLALALEE